MITEEKAQEITQTLLAQALSKSELDKLKKWKTELAYSKFIPGTNLLVCKVFLTDKKWKESVALEEQWNLLSLIEVLRRDNKKISLILDLNRSLDYYNFDDFMAQYPEHGYIKYKKIPLEDKVVPPHELIQESHDSIDEFFDKDGVIVVHCFNGRNRTGYIVSSYLCKKFNLSGQEAIDLFIESRGLPIEHEAIKEHLKTVYPLPALDTDLNDYASGK